jgi:hypothetical protein
MLISSEVCFLAVLVVVYIRYEVTRSLASFFFVLPSPHFTQLNGPCTILLCMVQLVCACITGVFVVHVSSRWYCSRYYEAHWHFIFYEIILVSVLIVSTLVWYFGSLLVTVSLLMVW